MKDLDDFGRTMESHFGLISSMMLCGLHELATASGSNWSINDPDTIEIPVNNKNADEVYSLCKAIRSGYSVGLNKKQLKVIKEARAEAHKFLFAEANDPKTTIERKIELVKLTSKNN